MSQTSALNLAGSKEVKMGLNSIGTRILVVCERSKCVRRPISMLICFGGKHVLVMLLLMSANASNRGTWRP